MAITISGSNDNISAADGSLTIEGLTASGDLSVDSVTVGTGASVSSPSANTLALGTNDSERVRVDSSGRVGVGTNSPTTVTQFQVLGTSAGNTATFGGINQGTSGRVGGIILGTDTDNSSRRLWGIRGEASVAGQMGIFYSSDNVTTPFSGTQTVSLTSGGNVKIENGNLVFSTSGTGIDFSATSDAAGMTSELLDDYEEGTWTPTISFNGNATGVVYSQQDGHYVKIGSSVTLSFRIGISNKGSSTGNLRIEGLPFRPGTVAKRVSGVLGEAMGGSVGTPCFVRTESSSSFMSVIKQGTGSISSVNNSDFTTFDNYGVITFQI